MKNMKKICAAAGAAAVALSSTMLPASAAALEADENGVYGQAGIVWMICDQWDHRKDISAEPMDETEENVISCTHKDVNITGNGQYTVEMSGYYPENAEEVGWNIGYLGVEANLDFADNEDLSMEIDECTIDGVTYTFTKGLDEEGEPIQLLEDPEVTDGGQKMIKIKNVYGNNAVTEPEMDAKTWLTTDPLTITFTISGLPTDKVEGYEDEVIEKVYGNGSIENDPAEEEADTESTAEDTASEEAAETTAAEASAPADTSSEIAADEEEESSNTPLIVGGVAVGVIAVVAIVIVVVKKKK